MITEINFFTYGDSTDASIWSNVPYLMSRELELRGITLNRINVKPNSLINRIANKILRTFGFPESYTFIRTPLFSWWVDKKIKRHVMKNKKSQFSIFMNFDMMDFWSQKPSLVFGDWTYDYLLRERFNEVTDKFQQKFIDRQASIFLNASIVLPLFEFTYAELKDKFPSSNIKRIKGNVINNLFTGTIDNIEKYIDGKFSSSNILFIGRPSYLAGLKILADAIQSFPTPVNVHIIGMNREDFPDAPVNFTFHGYLNKTMDHQRK